MKKIFYFIALLVAFASCAPSPKTIQRDYRTNDVKNDTLSVANGHVARVVRFGYDGHDYIMFVGRSIEYAGVVHDPDCHCHEKTTFNSLF